MQKCMLRCLITFLCLSVNIFSQENYFQQEVNYKINVTLNDVSHSLKAFEQIEYVNNSTTPLTFIYFHLWPNAYSVWVLHLDTDDEKSEPVIIRKTQFKGWYWKRIGRPTV